MTSALRGGRDKRTAAHESPVRETRHTRKVEPTLQAYHVQFKLGLQHTLRANTKEVGHILQRHLENTIGITSTEERLKTHPHVHGKLWERALESSDAYGLARAKHDAT
jgi:hypothetical protein